MKCDKCNKEITDPIILNDYGVNINSLPDQEGNWYYYCNSCSKLIGLEKARNKLNRQISQLKKETLEKPNPN